MEETQETDDNLKSKEMLKLNHYSSMEENTGSLVKNNPSENKKDPPSKEASTNKNEESSDFSSFVAAHYNSIESGFEKRNSSRIYYLRNFNNWIKSLLIKESAWELPNSNKRNLKVLDMGCGKGGDLFKWLKLNVKYMVCIDIAEITLNQFKSRYNNYKDKCQRNQMDCSLECEFIPADCTRVRLRGKYHDPSIQFDLVSCQFSFHYCFESLPQAECMLKNASECLKPGGLFIGTIPNANEIVKRLKKSKTNSFKNDVFEVEMCCSEPYPLFGAKYNFYLEGVVNCPEFLVHFPTFEKLALKVGLQLVKKEKFTEFFESKSRTHEGEILLKKIKALETYTYVKERELTGNNQHYEHALIFCEQNNVKQVGTLSRCEWDVISLYQTFVFKKVETTWK